jgi:peptidoglycan/LPS O-acetylase OafA/YrhL
MIQIPAWPWWVAALAFIAVIAVPADGHVRAQYDITASLLLMPLLVALSAGTQVNGMVARACAGLGLVSYGVYVIHVPLFAALGVAAAALHVTLPEGPLLALAVAALAALIAAVADRIYDRPLRAWLSGQARGDKPRNVAGEGG